ncbi:hypothetical protein MIB92_14375 [Aestuariirhabdus sp. Z084]|uniref:hypothetical protein n=1 Tax=Aestuariirhabdus haliotis TaxID=2918751 RepID=UPI00201B447B|nr:hypothetical protein [Aestuariirhabdus haliotis]MCL6416843.1 hypothetical protein [Aestuariirhabdus haliotis]MCL6420843.1 hypothetical protein [Aestuariirhabdus haliotis]
MDVQIAELPNTVFIALGGVVAATLTGIFSFVSLINQKEGKISEFRQDWIDSLRDDISKITSCIDRISNSWQLIQIRENAKENAFEGTDWLEDFHKSSRRDLMTFDECRYRVLLRLNREEDSELISKLEKAKEHLSDPDSMSNKYEIKNLINDVVRLSQDLLKKEWQVVKSGEKAYKNTKRATVSVVLIFVGILIYSSYHLEI